MNKGILKIYDSTIAHNESNRVGGIYNEGNMVLRNVTVSSNSATSHQAGTGGPTQTHTLLTGSPARGAGFAFPPPAVDACESTDQRGVPRPQGGNNCDIGAVEITNANSYVTDFILVDAVTDTDIRPLLHGDILVLDDLPAELSIRAQVSPFSGSIVFSVDEDDNFQTENVSPYALGGDSDGDFSPVLLETGEYDLSAIPFANENGGGNAGGGRTIPFEVR